MLDAAERDLRDARRTVEQLRLERDDLLDELARGVRGLQTRQSIASASKRVSQRTARAAARNSLSLPAEFVPFAGIAAILAVTSLDLYDACATAKDMNAIRAALDLDPLRDTASETCDWVSRMPDHVAEMPVPYFRRPDCAEQAEAMRDQGLAEDADELVATCEE